jgi:hypothetical protein
MSGSGCPYNEYSLNYDVIGNLSYDRGDPISYCGKSILILTP